MTCRVLKRKALSDIKEDPSSPKPQMECEQVQHSDQSESDSESPKSIPSSPEYSHMKPELIPLSNQEDVHTQSSICSEMSSICAPSSTPHGQMEKSHSLQQLMPPPKSLLNVRQERKLQMPVSHLSQSGFIQSSREFKSDVLSHSQPLPVAPIQKSISGQSQPMVVQSQILSSQPNQLYKPPLETSILTTPQESEIMSWSLYRHLHSLMPPGSVNNLKLLRLTKSVSTPVSVNQLPKVQDIKGLNGPQKIS